MDDVKSLGTGVVTPAVIDRECGSIRFDAVEPADPVLVAGSFGGLFFVPYGDLHRVKMRAEYEPMEIEPLPANPDAVIR
jgi:hypothetical protein